MAPVTKLLLFCVAAAAFCSAASATFSVTRSTDLTTAADVVDYDALAFSEQPSFDLATDTFTPSASGLYWIEWSVGLGGSLANVTLHGLPTGAPSLIRTTTGGDDTNTRCELVELTAGIDKLTVSTEYPISSDPTGLHISFTGFHLPSTVDPVVAFQAANIQTAYIGTITWDVILLDTHGGFKDKMFYTVPVGGTWVVTLRCGNVPQYMTYSTSSVYVSEMYFTGPRYVVTHWYSEGVDTYSLTMLVTVPAQYNIGVNVINGQLYSDDNYASAIQGFLYSPIDSTQSVAWYVAVNDGDLFGPRDPLHFNYVIVNIGEGWQADRHVFSAVYDGLYYITLTEMKAVNAGGELELLKNGTEVANLFIAGGVYNPTRSRAIILRLAVGDELWIRLPAGSGVKGQSIDVGTAFGGFRISS